MALSGQFKAILELPTLPLPKASCPSSAQDLSWPCWDLVCPGDGVSSLPPGSESLRENPDNLQSPHLWLGPRGMGAEMEEAEGRCLVLGHWTLGMVVYLQCKGATASLIFALNLFPPFPHPKLTVLWGHPGALF